MGRLPCFKMTSLVALASISFAAHAQQGGKPVEHGLETLRKEGKVSAKMLHEDERAERIRTVKDDGSMTKRPNSIRKEDRLVHHSKHPQTQPAPPPRSKHHTTLE
ncbi:hypothetical protein Q3A66_08945 [Hymenobacter sp. BT770]|uniref:hypothetical protein n=1 Tax=Hymenobacter sp. BT770 TaxID=2886942 RepID=UPI001D10BEC3|nr:hypothetical protein [Hymenobacter sp. BT770]MCC3152124.1 hypothetical protein [Hymenobacter sp. BT770]MDO3415193.1 hypothetical protein [Hymenobacter sp. BT770]